MVWSLRPFPTVRRIIIETGTEPLPSLALASIITELEVITRSFARIGLLGAP
jgi:hypothetical protein